MVATSARRVDMKHLSLFCLVALFHPGLSAHLNRVSGTADRRRVAEVKVVQLVYAHAVKQGGGKDVDALRSRQGIILSTEATRGKMM